MYWQLLLTTFFAIFSRFFPATRIEQPLAARRSRPRARTSPSRAGSTNVPIATYSATGFIGQFRDGCCKRRFFAQAIVVAMLAAAALGDTVTLTGKPAFRSVAVVGFRDGVLTFRGASGELLRIPINEIAAIEIDSLPNFANAERLAMSGDWAGAAERYTADPEPEDEWKRTLVWVRALNGFDRAGRFPDAVRVYVELLQVPAVYTVIRPPRAVGVKGSAENKAARNELADALLKVRLSIATKAIHRLQTELQIIDDVAESDEKERPEPTSRPALSGRRKAAKRPPIVVVELAPDSIVFDAVRNQLDARDVAEARRMLDRAVPLTPERDRDVARLLLARCRMETGEPAAAAADLLALAESGPPAVAAEALYYVAAAHRKLGRDDVAISTLRRLLDGGAADSELRGRAEAMLSAAEAASGNHPQDSAKEAPQEKK